MAEIGNDQLTTDIKAVKTLMRNNEKAQEIKGGRVLIVGFGREGKSTRAWLAKHRPECSVSIADAKDGDIYLREISSFDTVIRSPGVSPDKLIAATYITTATNIFFSNVLGTTIGITGTKGKSTTASLIAHILSKHYKDVRLCGNIGYPMLDALEHATRDTVFVIELSSHQLVDIRYSPHIAVLLEVVPEHLDYYPDFAAYKRAKENIFQFQKSGDYVVRGEKGGEMFESTLRGNAKNITAAVKVARLMNVPQGVIASALKTFTPLPHRLEFVGEIAGVTYVNDSLATIPEATIHALNALGGDVATLIAGGFDRGVSYDALGKRLAQSTVTTLILFPDTGKKIRCAVELAQPNPSIRFVEVRTMKDAVKAAKKYTPKGAMCLLSPASASFNLFADYEDRGNQFRTIVNKSG